MSTEEERKQANAYHAKWRAKNKKHLAAYQAQYREENRDRIRATYQKWKEANPNKPAEFRRKWEAENGERYRPRERELERKRYRTNPAVRQKDKNYSKAYYKAHPEWAKQHHRKNTLRRYGITPEQWTEIFEAQGRKCKICRTDKAAGRGFHIDHCHNSNTVRGILCQHCNMLLGHAKDSVATLKAAIKYLKETTL